jgi:hypothetical protein
MNSMLNIGTLISKSPVEEHMQRRHGNTLTPRKSLASLRLLETPVISSTGIKENRNKEEINQSPGFLGGVASLPLPFSQ